MAELKIFIARNDGTAESFNNLHVNGSVYNDTEDNGKPGSFDFARDEIKKAVYMAADSASEEPWCSGPDCTPNRVALWIKFSEEKSKYSVEIDEVLNLLLKYEDEEMDENSHSGTIAFYVENEEEVVDEFQRKLKALS